MSGRPKSAPAKVYSEVDLARFAAWRPARLEVQPAICNLGPQCWVTLGPPGCGDSNNGLQPLCIECGGQIGVRQVGGKLTPRKNRAAS